MARYSYSGNKKHKKKQNHASEYLPYLINELADEIEVVEQALSNGEEGQVLTADSAGKAKWSAPVGGSGGGAIESVRVYPDVIIVTGAGSPEANGLYIKVPVTDPNHNPVYKNTMRTMELSCERDEYWYIFDTVAQSALYGAAGGMTTPIADLEWGVEGGEEPAPTAMADTNYTGNAFDEDLVVADGEGGTKVIASPIAYTEMLTNISAYGVGEIYERPIFNNTGSNYTISRDPSEPLYYLTFDSPILSEKPHFLTVVPPTSASGMNPTVVIAETNNSETIFIWVCSGLLRADAFDGWNGLQLSIRIYY